MRCRTAPTLLVVATLAALAAPGACAAQGNGVVLDVEGGPAWLSERGIPASIVGTAGATLDAASSRAGIAASTLGACGAAGSCTAQGIATAAVYAPPGRLARWEVTLTGSGFALDGELPVSSAQAEVREYVGGADRGAFAGGGGGLVHAGVTRPTTAFEIGGWSRNDVDQITAGARLMRLPTTVPPLDSTTPGPLLSRLASFGDVWGGWQRDAGIVSLSVSAGWRFAARGAGEMGGGWAAVSLTRWVAPRLAVVAAIGRALEDPTRGTPAARYASLSFRVRLHAAEPAVATPGERAGPVVIVVATDDTTRRLDVHAAGASTVELIADFTDWTPVPLARDGDVWRLARSIAPGPHRVAIRVDGGEWRAPVNLPSVHDEFGGTMGLLTVP